MSPISLYRCEESWKAFRESAFAKSKHAFALWPLSLSFNRKAALEKKLKLAYRAGFEAAQEVQKEHSLA